MASSLVNIRLGPDDEALAQRLQDRGISLSDLLRRAIREEAARLAQEAVDVEGLIREMVTLYPTPEEIGGPVDYPDTTDRAAVRRYIQGQLKREPREPR